VDGQVRRREARKKKREAEAAQKEPERRLSKLQPQSEKRIEPTTAQAVGE
jgi:F0F1-type ATP synthase membrane subunit b/b'